MSAGARLFPAAAVLLLLPLSALRAADAPVRPASPEELARRLNALPTPLQSADSAIFVSCATPERADLRWPILSFANTTRENLSDRLRPIGSSKSPLAIVIGNSKDPETGIRRRQNRVGTYANLIIDIPNPDTVDLDLLRTAIAEALLREDVRSRTGRYGDFRWPNWFILAVLDTVNNAEWQAAAYESLLAQREAGTVPTVPELFAGIAPPTREVAFFFARWVLGLRRQTPDGIDKLIDTPSWSSADVLGTLGDADWQAYLDLQKNTVFAPGILSLAQFRRWREAARQPADAKDARAIIQELLRGTIGRPKPLQELCTLYSRAYAAFIAGDEESYARLRIQADDAAAMLEQTLLATGSVIEKTP